MSEVIPPDLLEILICPESHQKLRVAEPSLLERIRKLQSQGKLLNRAGEPFTEVPDGALVREDSRFAYAVVEQIPIMLIDEAIPLDQLGDATEPNIQPQWA